MSAFWTAFSVAFGFVFLMELGDKTQLVVFALASRGMPRAKLAVGAVSGFLAIVLLGGLLAGIISRFIDLALITIVGGLTFVVLGLLSLARQARATKEPGSGEEHSMGEGGVADDLVNETSPERPPKRSVFLAGFSAIFGLELGDKTQVATILLAATSSSVIGTLFGAWLALSSLAILGVFAGGWLSRKLPGETMEKASAILFVLIGVVVVAVVTVDLLS
ncbi:MAG: TMEM165/GDT1 family protein [Promethearchaeota archaeon]